LFLRYLCFVVAAFICMFCIFMTYSTSCCCHYGLIDPWNVCMYVCIYLFMMPTRARKVKEVLRRTSDIYISYFSLYNKAGRNYKSIIKQFSYRFLCIISTSIDSDYVKFTE
jgi:hypothetical protein